MSDKKTAVVLLNLGGPDSAAAVKPFLMNFFMDKNILRVPIPFRCILANMIATRRSKREARESYDELGGSSPLLKNTQAQAKKLQTKLGKGYKVFVCMRYWHPMSAQVVREVRDWGADEIVLLPLYPQYSTTTTNSSIEVWEKEAEIADLSVPTRTVCCYPRDAGYIAASVDHIRAQYQKAQADGFTDKDIRVLFSAHGLPEDVIKDGDPYQWQCERSAEAIFDALDIKGIDWRICYQSRVGPKKWISPSLDQSLDEAAHDNKAVIVYPHAFTQEHVETLVELDVEYKEEAEKLGVKGYYRAQTVGTHKAFIDGLAKLVVEGQEEFPCPENFGCCCQK